MRDTLARAAKAAPAGDPIAAQLRNLRRTRTRAWEEASDPNADHLHGLFQYPAMMVPQMQREILAVLAQDVDSARVWDPFVGSGTTLDAAMDLGLDFSGRDVNPLAILISRVKAGPYHLDAFEASAARVLERARADGDRSIAITFPNWRKWFRYDVAIGLSRLRRAIRRETNPNARRLHWLTIAETVRRCSNDRVSTVKLHARPLDETASRRIDVLGTFEEVLRRNLDQMEERRVYLEEKVLLAGGHYLGEVTLELGDSRDPAPPGAPQATTALTSPPYGDNASTVAYGQHSYLPLQCVDLRDIHPDADSRFLASTHAIDSMSLGGSLRLDGETAQALRAKSAALGTALDRLAHQPRDRALRLVAFFRDLDDSLEPVLRRLGRGSLMAWTVGNRSVGGLSVPLDQTLKELLADRGVDFVCALDRKIPVGRKRQARKNAHAETMARESVLVFRTPH